MYDLYGDPTDISGARDDARMEMKPTADPREEGGGRGSREEDARGAATGGAPPGTRLAAPGASNASARPPMALR